MMIMIVMRMMEMIILIMTTATMIKKVATAHILRLCR